MLACFTTPDARARSVRLVAASAYAASVAPDRLTAAEREEVVTALRGDAVAGQTGELFFAVISPEAWGISDDERLSFLYAFGELTGHAVPESQIRLLIEQRRIPLKAPPTPEQWAAAEVGSCSSARLKCSRALLCDAWAIERWCSRPRRQCSYALSD